MARFVLYFARGYSMLHALRRHSFPIPRKKDRIMKKNLVYGTVLIVVAAVALACAAQGSFAQEDEIPGPSELMQKKLLHANGILEGLTLNDYEMIEQEAEHLSMISLEAHWRTDLPPSYAQYNSDFQWAVGGLIEAAELKNLEGATLKYTQVVMSCVECHSAVRGRGQVASRR